MASAPPLLASSASRSERLSARELRLSRTPGIRGHSSFFVHFFAAALVVAAAVAMDCTLMQWCVLLLCIGVVLTAELFNSAIETLHRGLDVQTRERTWKSLDIAAGAVLMASITAAVVGLLVFGKRLAQLLGWWS